MLLGYTWGDLLKEKRRYIVRAVQEYKRQIFQKSWVYERNSRITTQAHASEGSFMQIFYQNCTECERYQKWEWWLLFSCHAVWLRTRFFDNVRKQNILCLHKSKILAQNSGILIHWCDDYLVLHWTKFLP